MTREEEKQLLLKDLCGRLPYGVIARIECFNYHDLLHPKVLLPGDIKLSINNIHRLNFGWKSCKPYLRPMSSMAEEEKEDLKKNYHFYFDDCDDGITNGIYSSQFNRTIYEMIDECDISGIIDWLNEHHFDYRGLIPMGLALEAPEDMYKTE